MNYKTIKYGMVNASKLPLSKLVSKIYNKISLRTYDYIKEKADLRTNPYKERGLQIKYKFININSIYITKLDIKIENYLCDMYLNHYFDILGSGFVKNSYNINPLGIEGNRYDMSPKINVFDSEGEWLNNILLPSHVSYAKGIWKKVERDYVPIDWQIDFKSGFRYSEKGWYKKQPVGKPRGADIKVPWEISRMQHLPQLSIFAINLPNKRDRIIKEFKNEVYDFAATNPINMGANWTCTMDVGIRAANMLIAHDSVKGMDQSNILDNEFEKFFGNFIYEHGEFIINNLEWNDGNNNNHYLSDICGLLFVSSYLERNEVVDSWLAFSIQEIINCMEKQFYDDGGNFEGSTSYHRLSSELMIYSTALVYGLLKTDKRKVLNEYNYRIIKRLLPANMQKFDLSDEKFFPKLYLDRLFRAGLFTMDITKQNGRITQIGDNDSGRFFKFSPIGELLSVNAAIYKYQNLEGYKRREGVDQYYDEDLLNHSTLISALSGIYDFDEFKMFSQKYPFEKSIIEAIAKNTKIKNEYNKNRIEVICDDLSLNYKNQSVVNFKYYSDYQINSENIKLISYPSFGLYIFKENNFYLSIYAGRNGRNCNGSHSHNDKLSFELNLFGKDIFVDPGTYLYTSIPEMRNKFRSIKAHNVIIADGTEQNEFIDLFSMKDETRCSIIDYGNNYIKLKLEYRDVVIIRKFIIKENSLIIEDECNRKFISNFNNKFYSSGYGKLLRIS